MLLKRKKVLVLSDWTDREHKDFVDSLSDMDLEVWRIRSVPERDRGIVGKLMHFWLPCMALALKAYFFRKRYRAVICWQQVMGFFLSWIKLITGSHEPFIIISGMFYNPGSRKFLNKVRHSFIRKALGGVGKIVVYSPALARIYARIFEVRESMLVFLPLPAIVIPENFEKADFKAGEYIFSGGFSNRDFETLLDAVKNIDFPVSIACGKRDYEKLRPRAHSNVRFHINIPLNEFLKLVAGSKFIVIPLENAESANGQIVMLQAMALGRPVIMTRGTGAESYLRDGVNGLLTEAKDPADLGRKIDSLLQNDFLCRTLARGAESSIAENRSTYSSALREILAEAELIASSAP